MSLMLFVIEIFANVERARRLVSITGKDTLYPVARYLCIDAAVAAPVASGESRREGGGSDAD